MPIPIITTGADQALRRMLIDAQREETTARQRDAEMRLMMLREDWRHYVYAQINRLYKTDAVKQAVTKHVSRTFNVMLQMARRVCVVYKQPPVRRLVGAPEASQQAWAALMREAEMDTRMESVEMHVFAANVDIVCPVVYDDPSGRGKRLRYDEILPHCAEVITPANDPMGTPESCTYSVKDGSDGSDQPLTTAILDREATRFYDSHDRIIPGATITHGIGVFPATPFRLEHPDDDWWCSHRGAGIVDATLKCAHIAARLDWVRHGQDRYKEIMISERMRQISSQVLTAEGPLEIPLAPGEFDYKVLDTIISIDEHEKHLRLYLHQAADSYGVPAAVIDFDAFGASETTAPADRHAALADVRARQIKWYRRAEHDLAWRTALMLKAMGHPLAGLLAPDMVAECFEIEFPELTFVEHPETRTRVAVARVQAGLSSTIREYQREHPELTFEESKAQVIAIAEEEGELNELYIRNNWPRGAAGKQTLAQAQGAEGGRQSGEARQPENDDDNAGKPGRAERSAGD